MASSTRRGKHYGNDFERLVALQAAVHGMLLVEHGVKVRYVGSKFIPLKSDLDYRLMYQGRCAFFDAKSRQGSTLPLSSLSVNQRALVAQYTQHGFVAGFLAELRALDCVVFFSHADVLRVGDRGSLGPGDGKVLGASKRFALSLLLSG